MLSSKNNVVIFYIYDFYLKITMTDKGFQYMVESMCIAQERSFATFSVYMGLQIARLIIKINKIINIYCVLFLLCWPISAFYEYFSYFGKHGYLLVGFHLMLK